MSAEVPYPKRHPTDFIHGLLSLHVHETYKVHKKKEVEPTVNAVVELSGDVTGGRNTLLKNWKFLKWYGDPTNSSNICYGVLYVNNVDKQAVLAYNGVDIVGSLKAKSDSLKAACETFHKNLGDQDRGAFDTTEKVLDIIRSTEYNDYSLSFTGHSLGGWLAELSLYFCHKKFECGMTDNIKAVTFDSPGIAGQIEKYMSSIHSSDSPFDSSNIVTYLSAPNLVNICHGHAGTVYRLFSEQLPVSLVDKIRKKLPKYISEHLVYLDALLAVKGSNLKLMLNTFDSATGLPSIDKYRKVLDWPTIQYTNQNTNCLEGALTGGIMAAGTISGVNIPCAKGIAKVAAFIFRKALPTTTCGSVLAVILSLMTGDNKLEQLFETYKQLDISKPEFGYPAKKEQQQTCLGEFSLNYLGHYRIDPNVVNHAVAIIPEGKGNLEWYLKRLCKYCEKYSARDSKRTGPPPVLLELFALADHYTISKPNLDKKREIVVSKGDSNISVEQLKDEMSRLIKSDTEVSVVLGGYGSETPLENIISGLRENAVKFVALFSANNVKKEQYKSNNALFSHVQELVDCLGNQEKGLPNYFNLSKVGSKLRAEDVLNCLYCMHALASYYLYDGHDRQKACEILSMSKALAEEFVLHTQTNKQINSKLRKKFENLKGESIFKEIESFKHIPQMYTSIIYLLGRTYIYQEDKNDGEKYFELSKYLGEKLGLFDGYLSERSGLGVIEADEIERCIKEKKMADALCKLKNAVQLYQKLKNDSKEYKNEYKPTGEYQTVIPTQDTHNQVECTERLIKCYMQLIQLTDDKKTQAAYVIKLSEQFIGNTKSPGLLKQLGGVSRKKVAGVYNTVGQVLLTLYDVGLECKDFKAETMKFASMDKDSDFMVEDDLEFIKHIFTLAKQNSKERDFTKADAYDDLIMVCERQLEQEVVRSDDSVKSKLEICKLKYEGKSNEINANLRRKIKYERVVDALPFADLSIAGPRRGNRFMFTDSGLEKLL